MALLINIIGALALAATATWAGIFALFSATLSALLHALHIPSWLLGFEQAQLHHKPPVTPGMLQAQNWTEWQEAAAAADEAAGRGAWRAAADSSAYDAKLIAERAEQLENALAARDWGALRRCLRAGLNRNLGGIADPSLYAYCHVGTKLAIERYVDAVAHAAMALASAEEEGGSESWGELEDKVRFFKETCHAYGATALLLSGGGALAFFHNGVVKALVEAGTLPRVIAGSSGGSLVAGIVCTRTVAELQEEFHVDADTTSLEAVKGEPFEPISLASIMRKVKRVWRTGALFDSGVLERFTRENIGPYTFLEAYQRTGRVLNITVTDSEAGQTSVGDTGARVLNYLTAPHVLVWSAALASCAIPGVFAGVQLQERMPDGSTVPYSSPSKLWVDGSIGGDLPTTRLAEMFNINQFIVSQVNPWVAPLLPEVDGPPGDLPWTPRGLAARSWHAAGILAAALVRAATETGFIPVALRRGLRLLVQPFAGDITLVPTRLRGKEWKFILGNPTPEFMVTAIRAGQAVTWPKLSLILGRCAIETALSHALHIVQIRAEEAAHAAPVRERKPDLGLRPASTGASPTLQHGARRRVAGKGSGVATPERPHGLLRAGASALSLVDMTE